MVAMKFTMHECHDDATSIIPKEELEVVMLIAFDWGGEYGKEHDDSVPIAAWSTRSLLI
jgi:hypothetical protein